MTQRFRWLSLLAGAFAFSLSRDTGHWGWLVLVAPVPVLLFAIETPSLPRVALVGFCTGLVAEAGLIVFYAQLLPIIFVIAAFQGLLFMSAVLFFKASWARTPGLAAVGYATFTAATEYLVSLGSPNGSFGALGYSLVDVLLLLQAASLGGVPALSFLAALVPAGLTVAWLKPRALQVQLSWLVPLVGAFAFGSVQLLRPAEPGAMKVALLANDQHVATVIRDPSRSTEVVDAFAQPLAALTHQAPDVVVLPEKLFAGDADAFFERQGQRIVAGIDLVGTDAKRNEARLYQPGQTPQTYAKQRMVPGLEREYAAGSTPLVTTIGPARIGVAICKDMDFARVIRAYGQQNVQLMLVPAWDFGRDARLHGRMAVVRGVENGFSVARSASQGLLTLSDDRGSIVAEVPSEVTATSLVAEVPLGSGSTLYARWGDVFAQGLMGLLLAMALALAVRTR